ncbi:WD40-repeat-containing domain protein, partial [Entophlyctis helioformis]
MAWDVGARRLLHTLIGHNGPVLCLAASNQPGSISLALSGSADKTARLWSVPNGSLLRVFSGHQDGITSVAFGRVQRHNGGLADTVITASADGTARVWDAYTGATL